MVHEDDETEAADTVTEIADLISKGRFRPRDIAILFRTNEQPRLLETQLRKANVPYVLVGGTSFFDRKEVQDVLAYLRLLVDPHDDLALMRVVNRPPRGIGKETSQLLRATAKSAAIPMWKVMCDRKESLPLTQPAKLGITAFTDLIQQHRALIGSASPSKILKRLIDVSVS